jgi:RNA polymerase sigma factor (sigma-70 family)
MIDGERRDASPHVQTMETVRAPGSQRDGMLLKRFVDAGDVTAFEELVQRHAPMVLGVCRRILDDYHDAEDAFQATFLIMVRRAAAIRKPDALGAWLYAVARQTAIRSRKARRRRDRLQVRTGSGMNHAPADRDSDEIVWRDLRPVLDEELGRMPEKYRAPLVLCYLQDRSNAEAAEQLGWPVGTVKGRLARARLLLQHRLTRRGIALSVALIATSALARAALAVDVPHDLTTATVHNALRVAGGSAPTGAAVTNLYRAGLRSATLGKALVVGTFLAFLGAFACLVVMIYWSMAGRVPHVSSDDSARHDVTDRHSNMGHTEPAGVAMEARLAGARDFYTLDLGGQSAEEFRKRIGYAPRRPGIGGLALPPSPAVDLRLEVTNTGKEEVRIRVRGVANRLTLDLNGPGAVYAPVAVLTAQPPLRRAEVLVLGPGQTVVVAEVPTLGFPKPGVGSQAYWTAPGEYRLSVNYLLEVSPAPNGAPDGGDGFGQVTVHSAAIALKVVEAK